MKQDVFARSSNLQIIFTVLKVKENSGKTITKKCGNHARTFFISLHHATSIYIEVAWCNEMKNVRAWLPHFFVIVFPEFSFTFSTVKIICKLEDLANTSCFIEVKVSYKKFA